MDKYISKDDVRRLISKAFTDKRFATTYDYAILFDEIDDIPNADLESKDKWISFNDKQPQEGGFYLTYYAEHIHVSQWFPSKNWYNEHGGNVTNMVEYWQPLPELPKEEKMTLDEMISECLKVAENQCKVAAELWDHRQLAEWLKELQEDRMLLEALKVNKYITKEDAINALVEKGQHSNRYKLDEIWELNFLEIQEAIDKLPAKLIKKVGEE